MGAAQRAALLGFRPVGVVVPCGFYGPSLCGRDMQCKAGAGRVVAEPLRSWPRRMARTGTTRRTHYIDVEFPLGPCPTLRRSLVIFLLLLLVPIGWSAVRYLFVDPDRGTWQTADRSSAGLLPPASTNKEALIRVYAARTVRWRGIFAVHSWIVVKERGAPAYTRYDYTAWGEPIRSNGFAADGRWFGAIPESIV